MGIIADKIRQAIYGIDVREDIAQGIEVTEQLRADYDQQVINAGNSNAEIVAARGGEVSLPVKINKIDSSLSDKANQTDLINTNINVSTKASTEYVDNKIGTIGNTKIFKGSCLFSALPLTGMLVGDYWYVTDQTTNYCYNGTIWVNIGNNITLGKGTVAIDKLTFVPLEGVLGNNLFNLNDIFSASYVAYNTGIRSASANTIASNFITILADTQYTIIGASSHIAFYDVDKEYISGLEFGGGVWTSPSNANYIRVTVPNESISNFQLAQGIKGEYESYGGKLSLQKNGYVDDSMLKNTTVVKGIMSPNLFDKNNVTLGYYIAYNTGSRTALTGYYVSDYIPILPNTQYCVSGNGEQGAFYDINKKYISGFSIFTNPTTTPVNAYYIRLTITSSALNTTQIEQNTHPTPFKTYGTRLPISKISGFVEMFNVNNIIIMKADGGGDYSNLYEALTSITNASPANRYNILLYEGIYDCIGCLPSNMLNNPSDVVGNRGLEVPKFVNIIGIGDRDKIILKGELPDTATVMQAQYLSTLNYSGTVGLQNITVTAKNLRYPIHSDSGAVMNCRYTIDNCVIIHYGNYTGLWQYCSAFGSGFGESSIIKMKNSKFITYGAYGSGSAAWSIHNSPNLASSSVVEIDSCECIHMNNDVAIHFGSMGSGQSEKAIIKNSYVQGTIENVKQTAYDGALDFTVTGFGISNTIQTF